MTTGRRKPRGASTTRRRGRPKRSPLERLLIVCEGEKTEPLYLESLRQEYRLPTADIQIIPSAGGGAAKSIVRKARRLEKKNKRANRRRREPLFDAIWCVFDAENPHNNPGVVDAIKEANERRYKIALSVPCFEYWLLLHYCNSASPQDDCAPVLRALHGECPGYSKGRFDFDAMKGLISDAIERSRERLRAAGGNEKKPCRVHDLRYNPSTRVHLLVEHLIKIGEEFQPY